MSAHPARAARTTPSARARPWPVSVVANAGSGQAPHDGAEPQRDRSLRTAGTGAATPAEQRLSRSRRFVLGACSRAPLRCWIDGRLGGAHRSCRGAPPLFPPPGSLRQPLRSLRRLARARSDPGAETHRKGPVRREPIRFRPPAGRPTSSRLRMPTSCSTRPRWRRR